VPTLPPSPPQLFQFALLVRDYDEAINWYTRALGWQLLEDSARSPTKRWVVIGQDGGFQLLLAKAATPEQAAHIGRQGGGRVWLFLRSEDFDADCARNQLEACAVRGLGREVAPVETKHRLHSRRAQIHIDRAGRRQGAAQAALHAVAEQLLTRRGLQLGCERQQADQQRHGV